MTLVDLPPNAMPQSRFDRQANKLDRELSSQMLSIAFVQLQREPLHLARSSLVELMALPQAPRGTHEHTQGKRLPISCEYSLAIAVQPVNQTAKLFDRLQNVDHSIQSRSHRNYYASGSQRHSRDIWPCA